MLQELEDHNSEYEEQALELIAKLYELIPRSSETLQERADQLTAHAEYEEQALDFIVELYRQILEESYLDKISRFEINFVQVVSLDI